MLAWQFIVVLKFRNSNMRGVIRRTYDKVYLYPIAMMVCWTLNLICDNFLSISDLVVSLSMIFGIVNGILSALIFMLKSEEAKRRWQAYLFPPKDGGFDDFSQSSVPLDFEFDEDTDFESGVDIRLTDLSTNMSMSKPSDVSMISVNPIH